MHSRQKKKQRKSAFWGNHSILFSVYTLPPQKAKNQHFFKTFQTDPSNGTSGVKKKLHNCNALFSHF